MNRLRRGSRAGGGYDRDLRRRSWCPRSCSRTGSPRDLPPWRGRARNDRTDFAWSPRSRGSRSRAPRSGRPKLALVLARRHENQFGAAQCQGAGDFGHVYFAAHRKPDLAVNGLEHGKFVAGYPLEFPGRPAGVDPGAIRMRAAVACRRAAVRIRHADEVVRGPCLVIDRLDRTEHHVRPVPRGRLDQRRGWVEARRHAPRPWIGLREADEVRPLLRRTGDRTHCVRYIRLIGAGRMADRLYHGDAEGHDSSLHPARRQIEAAVLRGQASRIGTYLRRSTSVPTIRRLTALARTPAAKAGA